MKKNWKYPFIATLSALLPLGYAFSEENSTAQPKAEERVAQASLPLPINRINQHISEMRTFLQEETQNNTDVLIEFDNLSKMLKNAYLANNAMNEGDIHIVLEAVGFAAEKFKGQTKNQAPYVLYPIRVAEHLITIGSVFERDILVASLLHETTVDAKTSYQDIRKVFGNIVEGYVKELADGSSLPSAERKNLQIVNAPQKSKAAAQISLAEKYEDLKTLKTNPPSGWDQKQIDEYFAWSQAIIEKLPNSNDSLKKAVKDLISLPASSAEKTTETKVKL